MSVTNGYIKVHRKLVDWEWYDSYPEFKLFMHLLLTVNHSDSYWHGECIERGSRVTSLSSLSNETGLSIQQLRTAIRNLKSTNEITSISRSKNTLFIVLNYDKYQGDNTIVNTLPTKGKQTFENKHEETTKINYQQIVDMYNEICVSFSKVQKVSEERKKAIKARLKTYSIEDIKKAFMMAEQSDFLKGKNSRNWAATFDWMMKDTNLAKILEGNYIDRNTNKELPDWYFNQDLAQPNNVHVDDEELKKLQNMLND